MGTKSLREVISDIADLVREKVHAEIPVDVKEMVALLNGKCVEVSVPNQEYDEYFDARLITLPESDTNDFAIYYAAWKPETRIRFSIAHELGHFFLHSDLGATIQQYNRRGSSEQEREANEFAACLLMPENIFEQVCSEYTDGDGIVNISKVADRFQTSIQATEVRGKILGLL